MSSLVDDMNRAFQKFNMPEIKRPRITPAKTQFFWAEMRGRTSTHRFSEPLASPVQEACKFLTMSTRESPTTGMPVGVTQECVHPAHDELELLQLNMSEVISFLQEMITHWDLKVKPQLVQLKEEPFHIEVVPAEALLLNHPDEFKATKEDQMGYWVNELRNVCAMLLERLEESHRVERNSSDEKGFTDEFSNETPTRRS